MLQTHAQNSVGSFFFSFTKMNAMQKKNRSASKQDRKVGNVIPDTFNTSISSGAKEVL